MKLLISDANIIIDLEVGGIIQQMFALGDQFGTPDVLFAEELQDHHPHLPQSGLKLLSSTAAACFAQ